MSLFAVVVDDPGDDQVRSAYRAGLVDDDRQPLDDRAFLDGKQRTLVPVLAFVDVDPIFSATFFTMQPSGFLRSKPLL
ncbi:MAG: hypothetical protein WDN30_07675 [Pararobbsia sp.]